MREVPELLDGVLEIVADLLEHLLRRVRIAVGELANQVDVHRQRDEVLLRAVVEVALDLAPRLVGRCNDPRPRRAQLFEQRRDGCGIGFDELARKAEFHRKRDEMLLRAVVEIPFDLTA